MIDDNTKANVLMPGITSIAARNGCEIVWDGLKLCVQREGSDQKNLINVQKVIDLMAEDNYHGISTYIKELCITGE